MTLGPKPSLGLLFGSFFMVGISGFGSVLPWSRRMIVEQRRWLDAEGFNDLLSLCQLVPGPNMINFATVLGDRYHGPIGSVVAVTGLISGPMAIVLTLLALLSEWAEVPVVMHAFHGLGAAAAGLVLATTIKISWPLVAPKAAKRDWRGIGVAVLAFTGIALLHWPLLTCLAVLAPASVLLQLARR